MRPVPRLVCTGSIAALLLGWAGAASKAKAQTANDRYWSGGGADSVWSTSGNWVNSAGTVSAAPGTNNQAIFDYTNSAPREVTSLGGTGRTVGSLRFRTTKTITLGLAGQKLTISANQGTGSDAIIVESTSAAQVIQSNVLLNTSTGTDYFQNDSNNVFRITGTTEFGVPFFDVNTNTSYFNLVVNGSGSGGFSLDGNVTVDYDAVTWTNNNTNAAFALGSNSILSLNTNAGASPFGLTLNGAGAFNLGGTITNGADGNVLNLNGTGLQTINNIRLSSIDTPPTPRSMVLSVGSGSTATVSGVISNGPTSAALAAGFTKNGAGKLILSGANTFTGTATVNDGTLQFLNNAASLVGNNIAFLPVAGTTGSPVVTISLPTGTALRMGTTLTYGAASGNVGAGALINGTGNLTFTNPLTTTATIIVNDSTGTDRELTIAVPVVNDGASARAVVKAGTGALWLTAANSFTGTLQINQGLTVVTASPTATGGVTLIPAAGLNNAPTTLWLGSGVVYKLNGTLTSNSTGSVVPGTLVTGPGSLGLALTNPVVSPNTGPINTTNRLITAGDNTTQLDDITITVPIVDGANVSSLYKDGAGLLRLKGNNTYSGATDFFRGILAIDYGDSPAEKLSNIGDIEPRGGTMYFIGNASSDVSETVGVLSPGGSNVPYSLTVGDRNSGSGGTDVPAGSFALNSTTASSGGASVINLQSLGKKVTLTFRGFRYNPGGGVVTLNVGGPENEFRTTAANNAAGFLATNAIINGRWIANDGTGKIVPFFGPTQNDLSQWNSTQAFEINGTTTGALTLNRVAGFVFGGGSQSPTVALDDPSSYSKAVTVTSSGILMTPEFTGSSAEIKNGRLIVEQPYLTAYAAGLLIQNYSSSGILKISSNIGLSDAPLGDVQQITIGGTGIVELAGRSTSIPTYNQSTRLFGQVNVLGGATLRVSGGDAISDYLPLNLGLNGDTGGTFDLNGAIETIGGLVNAANTNQGTTQGTINLGNQGTLTLNQTGSSTAVSTTTFAGSITGSGTVIKQGNQTLNLAPATASALLSYSGELQLLGGGVAMTGASSTFNNGFTGLTSILFRGGEFLANLNTNPGNKALIDMIPDGGNSRPAAVLHLQGTVGSGLRISSNQAADLGETVSQIALEAGANTITVDTSTTSSSSIIRLNVGSGGLGRVAGSGATLLMRGTNLGSTNTSVARTTIGLANTAGLGLIGGGGIANSTTISILPYAIGASATSSATTLTAVGDSFVGYLSSTFRPLAANEYNNYAAGGANDNVSTNTNLSGLTGKIINSLRLDASANTVDVSGSGTLTLKSGALLVSNGSSINATSLGGFTTIQAQNGAAVDGELVVHVTSSFAGPVVTPTASLNTAASAVFTVSSAIVDNAGGKTSLTKAGNGTLLLNNSGNTFSGGINVNQGVLAFTSTGALGDIQGKLRMAGGTLQWSGANSTDVSAFRTVELVGPSSYYTPTGTGAAGNALNRGNTFDVGMNAVTLNNAIGNNGVGGLVKTGAGPLTLAAAPTYKGATVVMQGAMDFSDGVNPSTTSGLFLITENKLVLGTVDVPGSGQQTVLLPVSTTGSNRVSSTIGGANFAVQQLLVGGAFTNPITSGPSVNMADNTEAYLKVSSSNVQIGDGGGDSFMIIGYRDEGAANSAGFSNGATNAQLLDNTPYTANTAPIAFTTADFRDAGSVTVNVSRLLVSQNKGSGNVRLDSQLLLSNTANDITAGTIVVGNSPGPNSTGNSGISLVTLVNLGVGTTTMKVDELVVGGQNANGIVSLGNGGTFILRDRSGTGAADVFLGDNDDITGVITQDIATKLDLQGGTADLKINELVIGRHGAGTGGGQAQFIFDGASSLVEAATVKLAQTSTRSAPAYSAGSATATPPTNGIFVNVVSDVLNNTVAGITMGSDSTPTFRFGDMSQGGDLMNSVGFNWHGGTLGNLADRDAVVHNVPIQVNDLSGTDRFIDVTAGHSMTFESAALLTGPSGFTKTGGGDLILFGNNTYGGETFISGGRIVARNAFGSATGSYTTTILNGGELAGDGIIAGSGSVNGTTSVHVMSGGKLTPGLGTLAANKTLTIGKDLSIEAGGILNIQINTVLGTANKIRIGDDVGNQGVLYLNPDGNAATHPILQITDLSRTFFVNQSLTIIDGFIQSDYLDGGLFEVNTIDQNGNPITKLIHDYNPLAPDPNETFTVVSPGGTNSFWIDYNAGPNGDRVDLVAVPEPGALASLLGGIGMLVGLQRFRRRA